VGELHVGDKVQGSHGVGTVTDVGPHVIDVRYQLPRSTAYVTIRTPVALVDAA
jgi:hypothetical protein